MCGGVEIAQLLACPDARLAEVKRTLVGLAAAAYPLLTVPQFRVGGRHEQLANIFHGFSTGLCAMFRLRSADNCQTQQVSEVRKTE